MIYSERFASNLSAAIMQEIDKRHLELGSGALVAVDDAAATGMRVTKVVGIISGLKAALALIEQVERDMSQKPKKEPEPR